MNKCGLTQREVDSAKDGEVRKGCLILTKEEYEDEAFRDREDFKFVIAKNLKTVSSELFRESSLQFVFMPEVESIADHAFAYSSLTAVCFLKVKSVGAYSFCGCNKLNQVFLPVCEELGEQCFYNCDQIKILNLPKAKKIRYEQFWSCSSLTDLIIPLVEQIGDDCFYKCDSLESIDSKLDANQFRCTNDWCNENKQCPICRGQLLNCLKKGNDPQTRLNVQKELEEQKLALLKEISSENIWASNIVVDAQIREKDEQLKEKDAQIQDLINKMQEKDQQIQQISTKLEDVKQEGEQQIKDLNNRITEQNNQHKQDIEKLEQKFDIKVERMIQKFENQERENEEMRNEFKNFVRLLADK